MTKFYRIIDRKSENDTENKVEMYKPEKSRILEFNHELVLVSIDFVVRITWLSLNDSYLIGHTPWVKLGVKISRNIRF